MQENPELRAIFEADQADRRGELRPDIWERDQARRDRVEELIAAGMVCGPADHLYAAFIFQHGDRLEHYWQAHELALRAVELGHGHPARWLAAASYDRWLMHQGLPQKFGTQYRMAGRRYVLHDVEPATSDEDRARWDVPPLAEAQAYAEELTRQARQARQATPAPEGLIATLEVPGLRVGQVAISGQEAIFMPQAMPRPEPLDPHEPHPLPAWLPAGLSPRRLGEGYCAVDAAEEFQVTWIELLLPPGETLHLVWSPAEGPAPELEAVDLGGRAGVLVERAWSAVSAERLPLVARRAGPDGCWLVSGRVSRADLLRVAAALPG